MSQAFSSATNAAAPMEGRLLFCPVTNQACGARHCEPACAVRLSPVCSRTNDVWSSCPCQGRGRDRPDDRDYENHKTTSRRTCARGELVELPKDSWKFLVRVEDVSTCGSEWIKFLFDDTPHDRRIDTEITVDQAVPHSSNTMPLN